MLCLVGDTVAQSGDFNGDSILDCRDADLFSQQILSGTYDPSFDLEPDGVVDIRDLELWVDSHFTHSDVNLDGRVDQIDAHRIGLNWFRPGETSYCRGDLDLDGDVDPIDRAYVALHWYAGDTEPHKAADVVLSGLPDSLTAWRTEGGVAFARVGSIEYVAIPQRAPDGALATVVAARTTEPGQRIVTIYDFKTTGDLHHTWLPGSFGPVPTVTSEFPPTIPAEWSAYDSHLLIESSMIGANFDQGYAGINESNDASDPIGIGQELPLVHDLSAITGLGELQMEIPTGTFFFDTPFQTDFVELAYLVTPAVMPDDAAMGEAFLTIGVLGGDQDNQPLPDLGVLGLNPPIGIPFFPEPCDLNADGHCNTTDIDMLFGALGSQEPAFNLDTTRPEIDLADRDEWLRDAGLADGTEPYYLGDADLDGDVDSEDLNSLALNWQRGGTGWGSGDFDGSGKVDAGDLNLVALNWRQGSSSAAAVPEPGTMAMSLIVIVSVIGFHFARPSSAIAEQPQQPFARRSPLPPRC